MIDLILEKWITAFQKYGHDVEIFENPSPKEIRKFKTSFRFILDSKRQKVYIWDAMGAVHADSWTHIKDAISDTRSLYSSGDILAGTVEGKNIHFYNKKGIPPKQRNTLRETDWSFSAKWVDMGILARAVKRL